MAYTQPADATASTLSSPPFLSLLGAVSLLSSDISSRWGRAWQLEPINELASLTDCLCCHWSCHSCLLWFWERACCVSRDEEVEILGPFPAQTPAWLTNRCNFEKDMDLTHEHTMDSPVHNNYNSTLTHSSSDMSLSTFSLTQQFSDVKPIGFWATGPNEDQVQPWRRSLAPPARFLYKLEPCLYSNNPSGEDVDLMTDEEIFLRYQLGLLHFSAQYDLINGHLGVRVIEARDLSPPLCCDSARQDTAHSNPYVKMSLLPDHKNSRQTGVRRKTQNPVFEERFTFDMPFLEAQRRTLLLSVVDFDKFSQHCVIGKVALPLSDVDLVKGGHWWRALVPSSQNEVDLGELLLSLTFLPSAGRLNVDVIKAKQLLQTDMWQGSDPFVKVQLVAGLKLVKTKKTSCMRGTIDPVFNESLSFNVLNKDLSDVSLVFTVYGHNLKSSNDFVGRVVIGQFSTGPPETSHWRRLLASQRTPVEQWHSLRSRAQCDCVSPASLEVT